MKREQSVGALRSTVRRTILRPVSSVYHCIQARVEPVGQHRKTTPYAIERVGVVQTGRVIPW
jgi:hypothetical protein